MICSDDHHYYVSLQKLFATLYVYMFIIKLFVLLKSLVVVEMKSLLFSLFTGNFDEALSDVRSAREFQPLHLEAIELGIVKNPFTFPLSDQYSIEHSYEDVKLLRFAPFLPCYASSVNHGNCINHLRLDVYSDEYNSHDSLRVLLIEALAIVFTKAPPLLMSYNCPN